MNSRGWMAYFLMVVVLMAFCTIVIILFSGLSIFGKLDFSVISEREQASVVPFIIAYSESDASFGEKTFFQQMSYLGAGEPVNPEVEGVLKSYASRSANNYIISLHSRYLTSGGLVDEDKVSAAVIPLFTFEKKQEEMIVRASG